MMKLKERTLFGAMAALLLVAMALFGVHLFRLLGEKTLSAAWARLMDNTASSEFALFIVLLVLGAILLTVGALMCARSDWLLTVMGGARAARQAHAESSRTAHDPVPLRDVTVSEAIAYMCFGEWGRKFVDAAGSPDVSGSWEHSQFQQAAADGEVRVWGRPSAGRVYEPIPKEYWRENWIEWFSLLKAKPIRSR